MFNAGGQRGDHKNHGFPTFPELHAMVIRVVDLSCQFSGFFPRVLQEGRLKSMFCLEAGATFLFTWRIMKTVEQEFGIGLWLRSTTC